MLALDILSVSFTASCCSVIRQQWHKNNPLSPVSNLQETFPLPWVYSRGQGRQTVPSLLELFSSHHEQAIPTPRAPHVFKLKKKTCRVLGTARRNFWQPHAHILLIHIVGFNYLRETNT